ncbi:putative MFS transporter [Morchella snyderi]|nr:putative MFS transporter [Morchella snyderi]
MSSCDTSHAATLDIENTTMTERTPLLLAPANTYKSATEEHCQEDSNVLFPIISKVVSVGALRVESQPLPVLGIHLDSEDRIDLKEDDVSTLNVTAFHGGISKQKFWIIFTGILIANFVAAADSTIMASTHTSITSAFNSSNAASWLSTSFMLTSTSFQPLYGRISDTIGRKVPFVFSCFVFTAATAWCALAGSMGSLIAARAVCGIGAGGMLTMGAIVLSDILPIEIRGNYQSINNLAYGTGSALGAAVGGFLADSIGWRWEFGIQVPFGIFCMGVCMWTIPSQEELGNTIEMGTWERFSEFDLAGSLYLTTSVGCLILGMSLGGNIFPWTHPVVIVSLIMSFVLGNLLLRAEKVAKSPVMPLELVWGKPRGNLIFNNFFAAVTINTIFFNLPLYFQTVLLESATAAGTRLLVPSLAGTTSAVATGIIITQTGRLKPIIFIGSILVIVGAISLCCMDRFFPGWVYFIFLVPTNLGAGFVFPSTLMSILATSSQNDQAVATSTLILWRCLGSVIGVASSSLIVQNFLLYFLERRITGEGKREVIDKVRKSVTAIFDLPKETQNQVISSYDSSLRLCFLWSVFTAVIAFMLIAGIQLPSLWSLPTVKDVENKCSRRGDGYQKLDNCNNDSRNEGI